MPVCFQLSRKGDPTKTVIPLSKVDEEICLHMHATPDPVNYYQRWYNRIGMMLALGATWDDIIKQYQKTPALYKIALFMKDNYDSDNWREVGK